MKYKIDTTTWKRREHYEFFNGMDDPFWGTVVPVDFTECYLCLLYTSPSPRDTR